ncbi:MAG: NAD(P)/FAD-dependent oxidoreductase [Campylobacterota bacterium]|nr:NAD(P)/FAD-dependent oxidoreductase [Campylobacterota bacterium]
MTENIAIIGAGASGLISAILLASNGFKVSVYEKNNKVGKKLLATGNGRCNITNKKISLSNFHSSNKNFTTFALDNFTYDDCKSFFNNLGLEFSYGQKNRVYPMSLQASSVVEILEHEAIKIGVNFYLNSTVETIEFKNNRYILNKDKNYSKIIVATGSIAMPKLGSTNSGYIFAKKFGHTIVKPFASLVQLVSSNKNLDMITGVKIDGMVNGKQGDILFTKYGISGSAILDISRSISHKLQHQKNIKVIIDTMPTISTQKLTSMLTSSIDIKNEKDIFMWLNGFMNKKLARYIILNSKIGSNIKYVKFLSKNDISKIVNSIKNLEFIIIDTKGFESCEVCAGGVDTKQINPKTMESKLQKDLYFTGEVLDVDADCGGFNLHWAWASGYVCANGIMIKEKNLDTI